MPKLPAEQDHHQEDPAPQPHRCGNLFGCGEEQGTGVVREDIKEAAYTHRSSDRLLHMDEMDQETLDSYLSARARSRRKLLRASSFMGVLAAVGPWFAKLAYGMTGTAANLVEDQDKGKQGKGQHQQGEGRVHVVESNEQT